MSVLDKEIFKDKDYLEIGVRNDEQLIKMATIVQRLASTTGNSDDSLGISEAEKEQLMNELEEIGNNLKEQDKKDKEEE